MNTLTLHKAAAPFVFYIANDSMLSLWFSLNPDINTIYGCFGSALAGNDFTTLPWMVDWSPSAAGYDYWGKAKYKHQDFFHVLLLTPA